MSDTASLTWLGPSDPELDCRIRIERVGIVLQQGVPPLDFIRRGRICVDSRRYNKGIEDSVSIRFQIVRCVYHDAALGGDAGCQAAALIACDTS